MIMYPASATNFPASTLGLGVDRLELMFYYPYQAAPMAWRAGLGSSKFVLEWAPNGPAGTSSVSYHPRENSRATDHYGNSPMASTSGRRKCRYAGCHRFSIHKAAYCADHIQSPEAREFTRQLKSAADSLAPGRKPSSNANRSPDRHSQTSTELPEPHSASPTEHRIERERLAAEEQQERRLRTLAFTQRTEAGDYNLLLTEAVNTILDQAGDREDFTREIGALRYTIANALATEPDSHRLGLTVSRAVNAMSRAVVAWYATRDPKPVVRYGEEWTPPYAREGIVHYIWRHRPQDFEERYLATLIDRRSEYAEKALLDKIARDYHAADTESANQRDDNGKYGPELPLPFEREWEIKLRDGLATHEEYTAATFERTRQEWLARNPGQPLPDYLTDDY
jgi:hypothetical protein